MEERKFPSYDKEVEALIAKGAGVDAKEEVIDTYEDLLKTIWDRIVTTLGVVTVVTITERAVHLSSIQYPALKRLRVTQRGINFRDFRRHAREEEKGMVKEGFKELIANLFNILAKLTGTVLVDRLIKEVGI